MARQAGLKIAEIPVNWTHVRGSKVSLIRDSAKMFRDLFIFRFRHRNLTPRIFQEFQEKTKVDPFGKMDS